ncbi:MAG TPA: hypothetical protein VN696_09845 [Pyrinomonadaceae bacterium]|jgi:hypothetical protein|nr:hypothetical protein [Pyrinomonadaceae bacterium]
MTIFTKEEFSKHIGTEFHVKAGEDEAKLRLAEVKAYMPRATEDKKMERFSIFFDGPADARLPQQLFQMRHAAMGEFEIFLVPISGDESGFRYEAVFNVFK